MVLFMCSLHRGLQSKSHSYVIQLEVDKALHLLPGLPPAGNCSCLSDEPGALLRFLVEQGEEEETEIVLGNW